MYLQRLLVSFLLGKGSEPLVVLLGLPPPVANHPADNDSRQQNPLEEAPQEGEEGGEDGSAGDLPWRRLEGSSGGGVVGD